MVSGNVWLNLNRGLKVLARSSQIACFGQQFSHFKVQSRASLVVQQARRGELARFCRVLSGESAHQADLGLLVVRGRGEDLPVLIESLGQLALTLEDLGQ